MLEQQITISIARYGHIRIRSIVYSYTRHSSQNLTVCRGFQFGGTELEGVLEVQLGGMRTTRTRWMSPAITKPRYPTWNCFLQPEDVLSLWHMLLGD
jgi:hypothetical protein